MKRIRASALALLAAISLAACTSAPPIEEFPPYVPHEGNLRVVSSLKVWADIAAIVGGDSVDTQAIIASDNQDPHSYEATAKDQLAVNRADLTIRNGQGYDDFFFQLEQHSPNQKRYMQADISMISEAAADDTSPVKLNEHVWYDLATAKSAANEIAQRLSIGKPEATSIFNSNAEKFSAKVDELIAIQDSMRERFAGKKVILTESLTGYMVNNLGLVNSTPKFSDVIENGTDASPSALAQMKSQLFGKQVSALIITKQTGSSQSLLIQGWANVSGIPVISFSESQPDGETYLSWMAKNLAEFARALK